MKAKIVEGPFDRGKYPWSTWADGEWREQDSKKFGVSPHAFRNAVYFYANSRDMRAETSISGTKVRFRILPNEDTPSPK